MDPIINKLSAFGQIDDIKAWATDDAPEHQVYVLLTFRYAADVQRALRPIHNAHTKVILRKELPNTVQASTTTQAYGRVVQPSQIPTTHTQDIGFIHHHAHPEAIVAPEPEGTTRSVVFFDSRGNTVRLTPKFQHKVEKAWEDVRDKMLADSRPDQLGHSMVGRAVPEPWRGQWWIIYPDWDLRRNRATFESVEVARRVIKKMKREKWGGEWDVKEGRFVSDPIVLELLGDGDATDNLYGLTNELDLHLVRL